MARHSSGSLATRLFGIGCGFLYAVAVARLLGPRGYGIVAVAISTATVVATVTLLGVDGLAVREVAALSARKSWNELRHFMHWAFRTVFAASVIAAIIMAGASMLPGPYREAFLLGSLAVPVLAILTLWRGAIQGTGNVVLAQVPLDVVRWLATLALLTALTLRKSPATPATIISIVLIAFVAALMVSGLILRHILGNVPAGQPCEPRPNRWIAESLPFLAIAMFGIIGTEIGTLLLGWLSGPREAGLYQPIAKLAPLMMIANQAIEAALAPKVVHSWEVKDRLSLQRRASRSALASTVATATIAVAIVISSPYILRAFGPEFTKYQWLIVWIGAAQVLNAASGSAPLLLAMTRDMKSRIGAQAATMVVQVGLGIALIPPFGAVGAVISLIAAILVWSLLHWWLALRATGIDTSILGAFSFRRKAA